MCHREVIHFRPDRTNLIGLAAVETDTFIKQHISHGIFHDIMKIALHHFLHFVGSLFAEGGYISLFQFLPCFGPFMLGHLRLGDGINLCIGCFENPCLQVGIIGFVAVLAYAVFTKFPAHFQLCLAMPFDLIMPHLDGFEHFSLGNFKHFTLNHHDVVVGSGNNDVEIGAFQRFQTRVDNQFVIDPCNPDFADRATERNIGEREGSRSGKTCQTVGRAGGISRQKVDCYKDFCMIIIRKERPQSAVDQPGDQYFIVTRTGFPFHETAGKTSCCCKFLFILYAEGHKIGALLCRFGGTNCREDHGLSHGHYHRTVGLLGQFTGFNGYRPAISQGDGLLISLIHLIFMDLVRRKKAIV